jgi:uncharacterized RDD family membrane protein YckC
VKCPKCGYLGFEPVDRCRNCGYEFALASNTGLPDLTIRSGQTDDPQPLVDLALVDAATADLLGEPYPSDRPAASPSASEALSELPLFGGSPGDDTPLITKPSPPRPPLAVRRATPEVPRLRSESRPASIDLPLPGLESTVSKAIPVAARADAEIPAPGDPAPARSAQPAARLVAVLVDLLLLAGIDFGVTYFTMQICGLTGADLALLPKGPLVAFLMLQNLGYFVAFTAGGQTLGKMLMGIKVVADDRDAPPTPGQALTRTLVWLVLALPAGLGFVTTLFTAEHRGIHDRGAATRVVRAGA